ncbi:MAG: ABC transporter permease [Candidatus Limnocylindria bacterium]
MTATTTSPAYGGTRRSAVREFGAAVATIMVKELRSRMRGRRAFVILTVYLGLLALITYGVYVVVSEAARMQFGFGMGFGAPNASAVIGQWIFTLLSIFQLILVCFIAPGFTAGQISLEREKQTLDLLITTPLRPSAIVIGKLLAALAFVFLMIVAAVPISAIVLMYGGASVDDIVRQQLVLVATAVALGAVGLFFSALTKRTQAATVLTYCTMLALTVGTVMVYIFWSVVANTDVDNFGGRPELAPEQILYLNPGTAMLDVIANVQPGLATGLDQLRNDPAANLFGGGGQGVVCQGNVCFEADQFGRPIADGGANALTGYWWPRVALTLGLIAAGLTLLAMRLVVPAGMRFAFRRRSPVEPAGPMLVGAASSDGGTATIEELPEAER